MSSSACIKVVEGFAVILSLRQGRAIVAYRRAQLLIGLGEFVLFVTISLSSVLAGVLPGSAVALPRWADDLGGRSSFTTRMNGKWEIAPKPPLYRMKLGVLDKARGRSPELRFGSPTAGLSWPCAKTITVHFNDFRLVARGMRNSSAFRPATRSFPRMAPEDIASLQQALGQTTAPAVLEVTGKWLRAAGSSARHIRDDGSEYALAGSSAAQDARCVSVNLADIRRPLESVRRTGFCTGMYGSDGYTTVYTFDPGLCRFDNLAVARAIENRLVAWRLATAKPKTARTDRATKMTNLAADLHQAIAGELNPLQALYDVLNRYFPLHGCDTNVVSRVAHASRCFLEENRNGAERVFVFESPTGKLSRCAGECWPGAVGRFGNALGGIRTRISMRPVHD